MNRARRTAAYLHGVLTSSPLLRGVLTLMSGTLIAQGITLVLQIVIARTYTDFDKGLLGV